MPRTSEDVENYLLQLDRRFENDGGPYILSSGPDAPPVAIRVAGPIVAVRATIGPVPPDTEHQARFFRRLLEFNATDLMHSSYGLDHGNVVLSAALEIE